METLRKQIMECQGCSGCYGSVTEIKPFVFRVKCMPKIMVVTEQPKLLGRYSDDIKHLFKNKNAISSRINELFGLGSVFAISIQTGKGPFYWTHYIRCYGKYRGKNIPNLDACADKWLSKEIELMQLDAIISFGEKASNWLIRQYTDIIIDWKELIWQQFTDGALRIRIKGKETKIVFFFHPSSVNSVGYFVDTKLKTFVQEVIKEVS